MVTPASDSNPIKIPTETFSQLTDPLTTLATFCLTQVQDSFSFCQKEVLFLSNSISKLSSLFIAPFIVTAYICNKTFHDAQKPLLLKADPLLLGSLQVLNMKDKIGNTQAHIAASKGDLPLLKSLIEKGANLSEVNIRGETPACIAASRADLPMLELLIEKGVDLHAIRVKGRMLVHYAALCGNLLLLKFLIEKGADLNAADRNGDTPASCAASKGHLDILEFLESEGVDLKAVRGIVQKAASSGNPVLINYLTWRGVI